MSGDYLCPKSAFSHFIPTRCLGSGRSCPLPSFHILSSSFWVHHEICNQETLYSFLFCFQLRTESGLDSTGPDQVLESCFSTFQLKRPHREKMERSGPWFEPDTPSLFIPYSPPSFGEDVLVRRTDVVGG